MYNEEQYQKRQWRLRSIIECIKEGITDTKQIAEELGVSTRTIQRDIKFIRENQD